MRIIYGETNDEPNESDKSVEIEDDVSDDLGKKRRTTKTRATKRGAASSKSVEEMLAENDDTEEEDANRTRMIGERKKKGADKRKRKIKGDEVSEDDSAGGVDDGGATASNKSKPKRRRTKKIRHDKADAPGVEKGKNKQANDNAQDEDGNAGTLKSHINKKRPRPRVASKEQHSTATGGEHSDATTNSERRAL